MRSRFRICLFWCIGLALLIGLGIALHFLMPPNPRFVLHGDGDKLIAPFVLSGDGSFLVTATTMRDLEGNDSCTSLVSRDARDGREKRAFFRGLVGAGDVSIIGGIAGRPGSLDGRGFPLLSLQCSKDRRFCAFLHRDGLALADFQEGREWQTALKLKVADVATAESARIHRSLNQVIQTRTFQDKRKLREALELFKLALGTDVVIRVDRAAFAADPNEEEVCLPEVPAKMTSQLALGFLVGQVGNGRAEMVIRRDCIEITTTEIAHKHEIWPPEFSPQSSFLVVREQP